MNIYKMLKSKKSGYAMPMAMLAVVLLFLMGTALLSLGLDRRIFSVRVASAMAARSAADAPEIDGLVIIEDGVDLTIGKFAEVKVVESTEHDLIAKRLQA